MHLTFCRAVWTLIAAIGIATVYLVVSEWDTERGATPVAAQPDKPVPPPPLPARQPAPAVVKAWDPNAARNARDLYAAYETARALDRPDAWYVASSIAGACYTTVGQPMSRNEIQRQAALTELEARCKGFSGKGREWTEATELELRAKVEQSDSDLGRLLRAQAEFREGSRDPRRNGSGRRARR